jgi:uncharacterized membrane protein YhaH (DUF805 family)
MRLLDKCDVSLTYEEELLVIRRLHHVSVHFWSIFQILLLVCVIYGLQDLNCSRYPFVMILIVLIIKIIFLSNLKLYIL